MIPSTHLKTLGLMPCGRFVTTYSSDYKPLSERHPQVNQLKPRPEAKAAPSFMSPPQPPSCSLFPDLLPPFGGLPPSVSEASALTEARTQEAGVARETGPALGEEEKGQLCYVFGGKANVLEQQEEKDEPQQKIDVLYEEGVIVLSSHVGPACCEDFLRSVCRETGLQHLLHRPVASSAIITVKDAENWGSGSYLRGLRPALGLRNSSFLQTTSRQCSCCAWETEYLNGCCFMMQTFPPGIPRGRTLPLARVQPSTESSSKPLLTEYQASYTAEWAQPKIQQSDFYHLHPPRHQIIDPIL
ncbi:uncharacterized protein [Enoplosus armatus]|uniref:uncharacterized protein n=1 Tax=Enoplosus armatus TaxID=215367 RepID=UPI0039956655